MPTVQTATPIRRSTRSTRASQPLYDDASDEDESKVVPKKSTKATKKPSLQPQEVKPEQSPLSPRYNTRSKQAQSSKPTEGSQSDDEEGVEELPVWPRYKDDLPNAFNGEVDPSQDFISKAPVEIIDNILSFLILDHDPDRAIRIKEGDYTSRPHVFLSMSAMSKLFYHATEGFAHRFLVKNKEAIAAPWFHYHPGIRPETFLYLTEMQEKHNEKKKGQVVRRSTRLACKPQPEKPEACRMKYLEVMKSRCAICLDRHWDRGQFANLVVVCKKCNESMNGSCIVCQR